jgi:hypothetical protein
MVLGLAIWSLPIRKSAASSVISDTRQEKALHFAFTSCSLAPAYDAFMADAPSFREE